MTDLTEPLRKRFMKSRLRLIGALALFLLVIFSLVTLWRSNTDMWTKQSSTFFKSEKPYGAGDFRVNGQRVISVKVSLPEITFKPHADSSDWDKSAEVSEPWMNDVGERKNRSSARFLVGTVDGALRTTLTEPAQHTAWWTSDNWETHLIATTWTDYKFALANPNAPVVAVSKMFRSVDGGNNWVRLEWPENEHISAIRFIDSNRGYAFGKGSKIWRTTNGGKQWQAIPMHSGAQMIGRSRREIDVSLLASDDSLWFVDSSSSGLVPGGEARVFRLAWISKKELTVKESTPTEVLHFPGQSVVDMQVRKDQVWLLMCANDAKEDAQGAAAERANCSLLRWQAGELTTVKEFAREVSPGALYILENGTLVVDAILDAGGSTKDVLYLSRDEGRTWRDELEGSGAQGVYMNGRTGERWRVSGHSIYKRTVK